MLVVNFAHPLTPEHLAAVERLTGQAVERVVEVRTAFDAERPFAEQARVLLKEAGLTTEEWQSLPLLVNLPAFSGIAALVLAGGLVFLAARRTRRRARLEPAA